MSNSWWFRNAIRISLGVAVVTAAPTVAAAQPSLFVDAPRGAAARETRRPEVVRSRRLAVRGDLLTAALAPGANAAAPFVLNLFPDVSLALVRERLESDVRGYASWVGSVVGDPNSVASLTWQGGTLAGGVVTGGVAYDIATSSDGVVSVSQRDTTVRPTESAPLAPARFADVRGSSPDAAAADGTAAIDVLVLYTAAARQRAGGESQIRSKLANAVAVTNTAFQRSGVRAVLTAVGIQEAAFAESADLSSDLSAISFGGTQSAAVDAARTAVGADLVALVTGRASAGSCGIAWLGPSVASAFSVTEHDCLYAGQWSFSHELGHNLGAGHAPGDSAPIAAPYAQGYRDWTIRTLMAYAVYGSPPRILNFSSPTVAETGLPTGNSLQDNARRLNETVAYVATYRQGTAGPGLPAAPTGLAATATGLSVALSWAPVSGAASYLVQIGTAPGDASFYSTTVAGPSLSGPIPAGAYYWRVRAQNAGGASPASTEGSFTVAATPPAPPTGLTAAVAGLGVALSWTPVSGANSYLVQIGRAPGDVSFYGTTVTGPSLSGPIPAGAYYWRVCAQNANGTSASSTEGTFTVGSTAPATPTGLVAQVNGSTVTLSWVPSAGGGVSQYIVEAGPTLGSSAYGGVALTQTTISFPNTPNGTYYLRVRAVGPAGSSATTADAVATVGAACVAPGIGTLTSQVSGGRVMLNWTAPSGTGPFTYRLAVGSAAGGSDLGMHFMGAAMAVSSTPATGTYYVRVIASNACGSGGASSDAVVVIP